MKVVVAGSRSITDRELVYQAIEQFPSEITEIVSGGANGVDKLGEEWANANDISVKVFRPDYNVREPLLAPIVRNNEMAKYADAVVVVWDGVSRGTKWMMEAARRYRKPIFGVIQWRPQASKSEANWTPDKPS